VISRQNNYPAPGHFQDTRIIKYRIIKARMITNPENNNPENKKAVLM
jgi:hypothetical protein